MPSSPSSSSLTTRTSTSTSTFSLSLLLLLTTHLAGAFPNPRGDFVWGRSPEGHFELQRRQCDVPCGWENAYCCNAGEICTTVYNTAMCTTGEAPAATPDGYEVFTSTFTEEEVFTSTWTVELVGTPSLVVQTPVITETPAPLVCNANLAQASCGPICCASTQYCAYSGQCSDYTTQYGTPAPSAPVRPVSTTTETVTSTASASTTVPFIAPVNSAGSNITMTPVNQGLSGGAIAGIVIGVLIGLFLLFLLLACLCCKGIFDTIAAIFGRRRRTEVTETYITSHHSSGGASGRRRPARRTWFGAGPARVDRRDDRRNDGGGIGGFLGVGAMLAALAVILGLKRRRDRRSEKASSYGSTVSYEYSEDYTTESSLSSDDRRTRNSRQSRGTRNSRR